MNILKSSCLAALVGFVALTGFSNDAAADLTLPNAKVIFGGHDNPAPGDCHPALQNKVIVKSNWHGWGPWSATSEVRTHTETPSNHATPILYTNGVKPVSGECVVVPAP
jgi:hypothetical protein